MGTRTTQDKADERGLRFTLQYASDFSSADDADNTDFFFIFRMGYITFNIVQF